MKNTFTHRALALATLGMLAACGGSDDPPPAVTHTSVGVISGFGSVIVNGVRFDDSRATITMDDAVATRDRLRVGMRVQVRGRIHADGTGVADSIQYNDCMQGPITALNRVQNTVAVMGQTAWVDDDTVLDGVTLRDMNSFAVGDWVEVSCVPDAATNRWRVTRMERLGAFEDGVSAIEAKGPVAGLDLAAGTFTMNGMQVDFHGVAAGDRPAGLANGMTVEVSGRHYASGVFTADRLRDRDRDRLSRPDGEGEELEGYVSAFVSIADFVLDGQKVDASAAVIRNGTAADIADGVKVEVEGTMSGGVLVASVVVIKLQNNLRVEAGLQAKDTTLSTVTLLGRTFKITADTELRDRIASPTQPKVVTLEAFNPADRLELKAYKDSAGNLIATRIERSEADALVVVKGPADSKVPVTRLVLFGIAVDTGAATRYRDLGGTLVDAATFYDGVAVPPAVPSIVHARGVVPSLAANVVDATRTVSTTGELELGED